MKTSNSSTVDGPIYRSPQWPPHHWPNLKGHPHTTVSGFRISWMGDFGQTAKNWAGVNQAAWNTWAASGQITDITGTRNPIGGFQAHMSIGTRWWKRTSDPANNPPISTTNADITGPDAAVITPDNAIWMHYGPPTAMGFVIPYFLIRSHGPIWSKGSWPPTTYSNGDTIFANPSEGWHSTGAYWEIPRDELPAVLVLQQRPDFYQSETIVLFAQFVSTPPA